MATIHFTFCRSGDFHFLINTHKLQHDNFIDTLSSVHPIFAHFTHLHMLTQLAHYSSHSPTWEGQWLSLMSMRFRGYLTVCESIHFSLKLILSQTEPKKTKKKDHLLIHGETAMLTQSEKESPSRKAAAYFSWSVSGTVHIQLHPLVPLTVLCL